MNGKGDLGDMIAKITENPEMMNTLKMMAGNMMSESKDGGRIQDDAPVLPVDKPKHEHRESRRGRGDDAENLICLLLALKPYVSSDKCEKIDSIVKILKLVRLSEQTGLLKSLL